MGGRFIRCGVITLKRAGPAGPAVAAVALVAAVVYAGTLRNAFALDDGHIILGNALVHDASGVWRAFLTSYWPPGFGGYLYRPLPIATYALDWQIGGGGPAWFHVVNLLWHVLSSVLVVLLAARWADVRAGLVAGLVFAVHPVHVEAVANIVGRAELMAAALTLAAVYAAVELDRPWFSAVLWGLGLLSKETAGVAPLLVGLAWWAGVGRPRPPRGRLWIFAAAWGAVLIACLAAADAALHGSIGSAGTAPVFAGHSGLAVRLTAVGELVDAFRLLLVPLTLRVDYSPAERTIVTSLSDGRFLAGALVLILWIGLVVVAWQRRRRVEAVGLVWVGLAYLPVSNLIVPIGILMAERTLYLASAGIALALGAVATRLPPRPFALATALVVLAGGVRTVERVPIWRDNLHVVLSMVDDSPRSYQGFMASAGVYLEAGQPEKALDAARAAVAIFPLDPRPYLIGAHAALKIGRVTTADSLLAMADRRCAPCAGVYGSEIAVARSMRDSAIADTLQSHLSRLGRSSP
jgi:hypothetical protein